MAESETRNAPRKEGQEMKVITKAKELAVHTFKLTINTNRYPKKLRHSLVDKLQIKSLEIYETLFEANRINVANKNKRTAFRKYIRLARLVAEGKVERKKFDESFQAYKNHLSNGNCYSLGRRLETEVERILKL